MFYRCNTTVTIYGDNTTTDQWGDTVDADVVVAEGVPASITEVEVNAYSESTTMPHITRRAICRISDPVMASQMNANYRIVDEKTNLTYIIMNISRPNNALGHAPIRIDMFRMGGL